MSELPALESRHAMGDFEKPQMSMKFASYVYIFWVLAPTSQNRGLVRRSGILFRLYGKFLFYIKVIFYRI